MNAHSHRTSPHTVCTAQCPRVRALCAAFPARSPLLPALTRSLRAASAFPTSTPHKAERLRSGTLHLCYTSKQTPGRTNPETHWGTRNRPRPRKITAPVPGSPDPSSPHRDGPGRPGDRGRCKHRGSRRAHEREGADTAVPAAVVYAEGAGYEVPSVLLVVEMPRCARPAAIPSLACRVRKLPRIACYPARGFV